MTTESTRPTHRSHAALWWLLGALAATLVFPGLGALVAFAAAFKVRHARAGFIILG